MSVNQEVDEIIEHWLAMTVNRRRRASAKAGQTPNFDARQALFRACGVNLTRIDGIDVGTAMKIIAEISPT